MKPPPADKDVVALQPGGRTADTTYSGYFSSTKYPAGRIPMR
jgi:hypothetical protein